MSREPQHEYIKISDLRVSNNKLVAKLDLSKEPRKYFLAEIFFAEYSDTVENIDESILVIPPLSVVITIAWAMGADVYVDKIDKTYLNSLKNIKYIFKKWFPNFSLSGRIHTKNIVSNRFNNKDYALLFSGGLDSRASYITNKDKKPVLISIWGLDIPTNETKFWSKISKKLIDFANHERVNIHFIKTNARELINDGLLSRKYGMESWWERVCHGVITLSLCAPITKEKIGNIIYASSYEPEFNEPWGSHPILDENLSWADVKIISDLHQLGRQEKIRYILKSHPKYLRDLRVCWIQHTEYNCGLCEKCLRTITGLVLEDIDPRKCGFQVNNGIFDLIKAFFTKGLIPMTAFGLACWLNIQKLIPSELDDTKLYNSKKFFEFFRKYDLLSYKYRGDNLITNGLRNVLIARYLIKGRGFSYFLGRVFDSLRSQVIKRM